MVRPQTPTPGEPMLGEEPAQFIERTGLSMDKAWRIWNEDEPRRMSRDAFRRAVKSSE